MNSWARYCYLTCSLCSQTYRMLWDDKRPNGVLKCVPIYHFSMRIAVGTHTPATQIILTKYSYKIFLHDRPRIKSISSELAVTFRVLASQLLIIVMSSTIDCAVIKRTWTMPVRHGDDVKIVVCIVINGFIFSPNELFMLSIECYFDVYLNIHHNNTLVSA